MSNFWNKIKNAYPKRGRGVVFALLLVASIIGGYFAFKATSDFVAQMTIANIPGAPIIKEATLDPEVTQEVGVTPTPTEIPLDSFVMPEAWDGKSRVNVLVMGLDARSPDARNPLTDTMILFTMDPVNNTAGMLSIPRDLWVKIPGGDYSKINTAYSIGEIWQLPGGGPALAVRTVENLLGVPIDYYAQIDFGAFVSFIDNIDGVKITVTERIQLNVVDTKISMWIDPGRYVLPGDLALAYIRNRDTSGGDFDRSRRQQQVIMAIRDRILEFDMLPTLIARAPQLYADLSKGIRTNLSLDQVIKLGIKVLNDIPRDQIVTKAINNEYVNYGSSPDGLFILRPIPDKIRELRDEIFAGSSYASSNNGSEDIQSILTDESARVSVRNASSLSDLNDKTATYLQGQGINIVENTTSPYQTYSSITFYGPKPYTLNFLVKMLGITNSSNIVYAFDPNAEIDIVMVLGDDFAATNTLP